MNAELEDRIRWRFEGRRYVYPDRTVGVDAEAWAAAARRAVWLTTDDARFEWVREWADAGWPTPMEWLIRMLDELPSA